MALEPLMVVGLPPAPELVPEVALALEVAPALEVALALEADAEPEAPLFTPPVEEAAAPDGVWPAPVAVGVLVEIASEPLLRASAPVLAEPSPLLAGGAVPTELCPPRPARPAGAAVVDKDVEPPPLPTPESIVNAASRLTPTGPAAVVEAPVGASPLLAAGASSAASEAAIVEVIAATTGAAAATVPRIASALEIGPVGPAE